MFGERAVSVVLSGLLIAVMVLGSTNALAAAYPEKAVAMIVAYSPGGGTDVAARTIASYVRPYLGQAVAVENIAGAAGQMGFTALAQARPDGYTIGFINVPVINILATIRPNPTYKMSDFVPLANVVIDPIVLAVRSDSPFKSMADLIDYARKNPKKLVIGLDGPQNNTHLQMIALEQALGVQFTYVFYDGAAPALTAALGGHVMATPPSAGEALSFKESGQLRVLTVFWPERFSLIPDVPTIQEALGIKIPYVASSRGVAAPKGVPADRFKVLESAFGKAINSPEFLSKAKQIGLPIVYMDGKHYSEYIDTAQKTIEQYLHLFKK
jgi:tripartite-type tricarboxylate transporter receptor subunit TctC